MPLHDRPRMKPHFFALSLIGLGAFFGVALIQIGFLAALGMVAGAQRWRHVDRRLLAIVFLFGGLAMSHSVFGQEPVAAPDYLLRWRYLLLLPLVPALMSPMTAQRLLGGFVLLAGLSGLYGVAQVMTESPGWLGFLHPEGSVKPLWRYAWSPENQRWMRAGIKATGTIHNIAAFAHVTMLILLWPLAYGLLSRRRIPAWHLLAGLLALAGLSLSGARAAWLGLGAGAFVLIVCRWRPRWLRAVTFALVLVIGGLGVSLLKSPVLQQKAGSLTGRTQIWDQCLKTTTQTGLMGLGYGAHAGYASKIYPQTPGLETKVKTWCHHVPLSLVVEAPLTIIPAAMLLVFLLLALTRSDPRPLQGFALASILAFWTISQLHDPHFQREFFPFAMLLIGCGLIRREVTNESDAS